MAIDFTRASSQHVDCGTSPGSASALSLSWWMTAKSLNHQIPLDKHPLLGTAGWTVKARDDGNILFRIGSNADWSQIDAGAGSYSIGVPIHVVCTFSVGAAKMYLDGVLVASTTGITQTVNDAVTAFRVARPSVVSTGEVWDGTMEDVRVYDRLLMDNEIATIYTCRGADGIVHGLVSRWKMLEGYPTQVVSGAGVVKDRSSGYDGTPTNSPVWAECAAGRRKRRAA